MTYSKIATLTLCLLVQSWANAADRPLAITNVTVIPMTHDGVLENRTVVIRDERIDTVGSPEDVKIPRKATIIDGTGKFLMPGLCDLHVHIRGGASDNPRLLALYLANGVTTVLNMGGYPLHLKLRDQIAKGDILGPTLYTVGTILGDAINPKTEERARDAVARQAKDGYDFIKVYSFLEPEPYAAIMDEARKHGLPVVGHAVRSVGLDAAIAEAQHLAHMEEVIYGYFMEALDESKIPDLTQRMKDAGISVIATLITYHNIMKQVEDVDALLKTEGIEYVPERFLEEWRPPNNRYVNRIGQEALENIMRPRFEFQQKLVAAFHQAGIPVLLGSDSPIPIVVPGYGAHDELQELVVAGLTPYEALRAGTAAAAEFLGGAEAFGTIEPGKRADLVLLTANPLEDIANSRTLEGVVLRGEWFSRSSLYENLQDSPN